MRVLHIGKYFPPYYGGMETFLRDLCLTQLEGGLDVDVLVHSSHSTLKDTTETFANDDRGRRGLIRRAARWFNVSFVPVSPTFMFSAAKILKRKPDVLHIHLPNASPLWLLLLPAARYVPWIIHWHSDIETEHAPLWLKWAYKPYQLAERAMLRRAKHIIATSQSYLDASKPLQRWRHKTHVIPLGIRTTSLPSIRSTPVIRDPKARSSVLFVGRLVHYKGVDILIDALRYAKDVEACIVGDGPERARLEKQARTLGVFDRVKFYGAVDQEQLETLFASADCFCLPSRDRTEAFGIAAVEAQCRGLPVIASDLPGSGLPWVARQAARFALFPVQSSKDLGTSLTDLTGAIDNSAGRHVKVRAELDLSTLNTKIVALYLN